MDRDRGRRYDDGEVVRYGAGESWRPTPRGGGGGGANGGAGGGDRSPRRTRSPPPRDRPRSPRPRSPRPPPRSPAVAASDSYVPGRYPPRNRSRSADRGGPGPGPLPGDRFRRERSRGRDSPRRRERTRSPPPMRRSPLRRSPSRRASPPLMPLRGEDRFERGARSPLPLSIRRDWDRERGGRDRERDRDWDRERDMDRERMMDRGRERDFDRRDDRKRSRSPIRDRRDRSPMRSPMRRSPPPTGPRGGSYRPRSRSPSRRGGDRYQSYRRGSPPRDSAMSSSVQSQVPSRRSSPRPVVGRERSPILSREDSPYNGAGATSGPASVRGPAARASGSESRSTPARSPPRGPAALRGPPPSGPAGRNLEGSISGSPGHSQRQSMTPGGASSQRHDTASPPHPPSGPRGYIPPSRGSYSSSRSRGGWGPPQGRLGSGPSPGPSTPTGPSSIPTGPRGSFSNAPPSSSSTSQQQPLSSRPFNPPTGPAAHQQQQQTSSGTRPSLAQSLLATMPPLIPGGGKLDPGMAPLVTGVTRDLELHYRKLRDEEEKMRDDLCAKRERLRKSLHNWDRLGRDAKAWELRSDLSERSMKSLAGEGVGGAAF